VFRVPPVGNQEESYRLDPGYLLLKGNGVWNARRKPVFDVSHKLSARYFSRKGQEKGQEKRGVVLADTPVT
jgi:hypothetical protein